MMRPETWQKWLRGRCNALGWELGLLTGQDVRALAVVAASWELYFCGDAAGQQAALESVRALLPGMQRAAWPFAKELIARSGDWGDRDRLWPLVAGPQRVLRGVT
jgi:hypothetical protein